jgi:hypothetical protein
MKKEKEKCFVIMPISDPDGYETGHFQHVYKEIISPACEQANYKAIRADDVSETNLIHLDVLKRLVDSPMAICDLSSCNPNVLFELGVRQAFDKPVVLIQEEGTPPIFDIAPLRYLTYRKEHIYSQVLEDQRTISRSIIATRDAIGSSGHINSIVKLLSLTPASLQDFGKEMNNPMLQLIMSEIEALRHEIFRTARDKNDKQIDRIVREHKEELACNPHDKFDKLLRTARELFKSKDLEKIEEGLGICKLIDITIQKIAKDCASSGTFNKDINRIGIKVKRLASQGQNLLLKAS